MPLKAVMVLHRCEKRLGHAIPEDDLKQGCFDKWLKSEDFDALPVSSQIGYLCPITQFFTELK